MVWNGLCAIKEHSKVIFCWLHFFHLWSMGGRNIQKLRYFSEKKFQKFFEALKWHEMDFSQWRSFQKWFLWTSFCSTKLDMKNSVFEVVWKKSKSSQKQFLLTILLQMYSVMWKAWLYFFIYMCNYVYFYQNKYVYLLTRVQNCNVYVGKNNWKKRKNESFIYIIMRIHVYNESIYESVYLFISKYNCA